MRARKAAEWAALGAAVAVVGAFTALDAWSSHRAIEVAERGRLDHEAGALERRLESRLGSVARTLDLLREEVPAAMASPGGPSVLGERMATMASAMEGVRTLLAVGPDGTVIASNRAGLVGGDHRGAERYRAIAAGPDPVLLHVAAPSRTPTGDLAIALGKVVLDRDGAYHGYVLALVDPADFTRLLDGARYAPDVTVSLALASGAVVARVPGGPGGATSSAGDGTTGERSLVAERTIRPTSVAAGDALVAAVGRGASSVFEGWRRATSERVGLALGIALLSAGLLALLQRRRGTGVALREEIARQETETLRRSEAHFRALAESAPVGIFQTDTRGLNVYLNPAAERFLGMSREEARGTGWHVAIHPEDRDRMVRDWSAAVDRGTDFQGEFRLIRSDGTILTVRGFAAPARDGDAEIAGYVGILVDVTRQRESERQAGLTARMASLGTLVAGVGHEINNPLTATVSSQALAAADVAKVLEDLRAERPLDRGVAAGRLESVLHDLSDAQEGSARVAGIVKDMASFASPNPERRPVALSTLVREAKRWLPAEVWETITLQVDVHGAPTVLATPGLVQQVIVNLVTNAAKATPRGDRDTVLVRIGPGSPGMARLEVVDHGCGIPLERQEKVFEPFYTTRPAGEGRGTGMGLAICRSVAMALGGTLTVESEVGVGSTFRLELPVAPGA